MKWGQLRNLDIWRIEPVWVKIAWFNCDVTGNWFSACRTPLTRFSVKSESLTHDYSSLSIWLIQIMISSFAQYLPANDGNLFLFLYRGHFKVLLWAYSPKKQIEIQINFKFKHLTAQNQTRKCKSKTNKFSTSLELITPTTSCKPRPSLPASFDQLNGTIEFTDDEDNDDDDTWTRDDRLITDCGFVLVGL